MGWMDGWIDGDVDVDVEVPMEGRHTTTTVGNIIQFLFHVCCSDFEPRHHSHPTKHFQF